MYACAAQYENVVGELVRADYCVYQMQLFRIGGTKLILTSTVRTAHVCYR